MEGKAPTALASIYMKGFNGGQRLSEGVAPLSISRTLLRLPELLGST